MKDQRVIQEKFLVTEKERKKINKLAKNYETKSQMFRAKILGEKND